MNKMEFTQLIADMRRLQKRYDRTGNKIVLKKKKELEKKVDEYLLNIAIVQTSIF